MVDPIRPTQDPHTPGVPPDDQERYRELMNSVDDLPFAIDVQGRFTFVGPQAERYGYPVAELIGRAACDIIHPVDRPSLVSRVLQPLLLRQRADTRGTETFRVISPKGVFRLESRGHHLTDDAGRVTGLAGILRDVTERQQHDEQLQQARKLEALSHLAGGIAHDFNNLLAVILAHAEFLEESLAGSDLHKEVLPVLAAGRSAANLTRQLLSFSRKQGSIPQAMDLNAALRQQEPHLGAQMPPGVDFTLRLCTGELTVMMDPLQLEQVVVNLVNNAREAITGEGSVTVLTHDILSPPSHSAYPQHGARAMLEVRDTGEGMDAATLSRVFEPFFSTRRKGSGAGLGMSTVFGIVRQSGGNIEVDSEPGGGTAVKVYLPQMPVVKAGQTAASAAKPRLGTATTILVVEDEAMVRRIIRRVLARAGYDVLDAACGQDALDIVRSRVAPIHLVLTDVIMPGMSGRELADILRVEHPALRILFISGFTEDTLLLHGVTRGRFGFLPKPFDNEALLSAVKEALA